MNQGHFAGRVGRDAQLRATPTGKSVLTLPLAVDVWSKETEKATLWVNCALWGPRAEKLADRLRKGTPLSVCGEVTARAYTKSGQTHAALDLRVTAVTLLGRADALPTPAAAPAPTTKAAKPRAEHDFLDDDIPF
jgi:single-strand DNA-binding protein